MLAKLRLCRTGLHQKLNELRSFLGFSSYYRFIKGFAKIAGPLHDLVNERNKNSRKKRTGSVSNLWGSKHQGAFESMKRALTTTPVLGYTDCTKPFLRETDARHDGLSAILSKEQDGNQRVITYASRCLRPSEKNSSFYSHYSTAV